MLQEQRGVGEEKEHNGTDVKKEGGTKGTWEKLGGVKGKRFREDDGWRNFKKRKRGIIQVC